MTDDKAAQTRKSFAESVKGKAKEVAGAITGNDSLTAEGQLEQTQAKERREASRVDAEAEAEAAQATARAREAELEGARERSAAEVRAAAAKTSVRAEQVGQEQAVEQAGRRDAARAQAQAEAEVQRETLGAKADEREQIASAQKEYDEALDDYRQDVGEAVRTEAQAERLRRRAEGTDDPNLP